MAFVFYCIAPGFCSKQYNTMHNFFSKNSIHFQKTWFNAKERKTFEKHFVYNFMPFNWEIGFCSHCIILCYCYCWLFCASFVWASSSFIHWLAALEFGAGVEQPFHCLIVQNRHAVQSVGRSMDWTLEDDMVGGLFFCATLTGGHTQWRNWRGEGLRSAPSPCKLNAKNVPPLRDFVNCRIWKCFYKFWKSVGLDVSNTEIVQCLAY